VTAGNISATAHTGTTVSVTANITGGNVLTGGLISSTANITGGNILTAGLISATGNVTGNYILGNGAFLTGVITSVANINNGTSNVAIPVANGNVQVSVGGTSNVAVFTTAGELINGLLSVSGNVTGGNILTGGLISATSTITSAANITGGNLLTAGLISSTGTVTGSTLIGSVVTATGNVTGGNLLTGGLISATSTITSAANITGGNLLTAGLISSTGTITGSSHLGAVVSVTANVTGGNILTGGLISATANITGGNILTAGLISSTGTVTGSSFLGSVVSVTGAITGGSITSTGLISTTGNIAGGNILTNNYYYANGTAVSFGVNYTASTTPPSGPANGWQWYNTSTDVLYEFLSDGVSQYWVDISSPAFAAGVVANVQISGSMLVNANATYDIGSSSQTFRNVYAQNFYGNATTALYADLAENYASDADYAPGTVLDFGGNQEVTISTVDSSKRVAGVVSTNPAHLMNGGLASEHVVAVALVGRVPTKVTGTVRKGDTMVSAGDGRARADVDPRVGTLIGKALEDFDGDEGTIEIVIGKH
jgi:hypothetical protein